MHQDLERVFASEAEIQEKVEKAAELVSDRYRGSEPLAVCVLKGGALFYADFIRALTIPVALDFIAVSTYGKGIVSSGKLVIKKDVDSDLRGRDVIIVEDIIDSGFTLISLKKLFLERGAKSVCIVTLLNKIGRRAHDITPDFNCFDLADGFAVGYGLDYDEAYRNLPYLGILKREIYEH